MLKQAQKTRGTGLLSQVDQFLGPPGIRVPTLDRVPRNFMHLYRRSSVCEGSVG